MQIHVGNLAREVSETELRQVFEPFGRVATVKIVTDRYSGVSRGFGFVEMPDRDEGEAAIQSLNMTEFAGRTLDLSEAPEYRGGKGGRRFPGGPRRGRSGDKRKRGGRRRF